jgi:uncharacterized protein (DUF2236 family)
MDNNNKNTNYKAMIHQAFPVGHKEAEGLFGPGSMHWLLYREPGIILGSYRALMLQVAHPAVADGVRQFSVFRTDYLGRAERTFTNMINIYFGDRQSALRTGLGLYTMHGRIGGTISITDGDQKQNRSYCANDPDLLLWVWATILEATLYAYEKTCRLLSDAEKQQFYKESRSVATLMGIPYDRQPKDLNDFYTYFEGMINGSILRVDEVTLDLATAIFQPPFFPAYLAKTLAAGTLPPRWRMAYQLEYTKGKRQCLNTLVFLTRVFRKVTPHPLGYAIPWYQAHYRVAHASGRRPRLLDTLVNKVAGWRVFRGIVLSQQ